MSVVTRIRFYRHTGLQSIPLDPGRFPGLLILPDMIFYGSPALLLVPSELHIHEKHPGCVTDRLVRLDDILVLRRNRVGEMQRPDCGIGYAKPDDH